MSADGAARVQEEKEAQRTVRLAEMSTATTVTLSTLATVDEDQEALQRMNLIVKADASGSLEAIKGALRALPQDSVALRFLLSSTGPITPSDVELARSSGALVLGAQPPPTPSPLPPSPRPPAWRRSGLAPCTAAAGDLGDGRTATHSGPMRVMCVAHASGSCMHAFYLKSRLCGGI